MKRALGPWDSQCEGPEAARRGPERRSVWPPLNSSRRRLSDPDLPQVIPPFIHSLSRCFLRQPLDGASGYAGEQDTGNVFAGGLHAQGSEKAVQINMVKRGDRTRRREEVGSLGKTAGGESGRAGRS